MNERRYSTIDRLLAGADQLLRNSFSRPALAKRACPGDALPESGLDPADRRHAAALMRVNHSGEVAAQALYQGQALTARDQRVRETMADAAREERDHLAWCEKRLQELDSRPSVLNPLWYTGSLAIGALAGLAGDRWSLGFLAETEQQVVEHLERHLESLPAGDLRSRAIVETMRDDEAQHRDTASEAGGAALPPPARGLMRLVSRIMTGSAYHL